MFKLSRYFSVASLIGIALIILILSVLFRQLSIEALTEQQTRSNVDLTHSFANSIWNEFSTLVDKSMSIDAQQLKVQPEITKLVDITRKQMQGTNVVKVKVYNLDGLTVFSTDTSQIGSDKSQNKGFIQALSGTVASEITYRNEFYALEGVLSDRNLVASYIPIRESKTGPVKAVFEVYTDVTPLINNLDETEEKVILGVILALALLYLFLFLIVRHADKIISQQEQERKSNEDRIRHQAFHDALTKLPNRNNFNERFAKTIENAKRNKIDGALMFLDLDRFKLINDSLGHDAGDQLLCITAHRIQDSLREMDMAFRLSGDEFVVILENLDHAERAALIAQRILEKMRQPINLNGHEIRVNISIGMTSFPKENIDNDTLMKEADTAMYRAKASGHNHYAFYTDEMNTTALSRLTMETDLRRALDNQEFRLFYQPKIKAGSESLSGVEVLLRWEHPQEGIITSGNFISLLEDTGLIHQVGEWVLLHACRQVMDWNNRGFKPVRVSVNISAKQFCNEKFVSMVKDVLIQTGILPRYLELELTETMFIEDVYRAIETMNQLKALGVSLAIDDFGLGFSSLNYLKRFPIDFLKIDRSFVKELNKNNKDASIITAIAGVAKGLKLGIVAEGVENQLQADFLTQLGCDELQGFLYSKPLPLSEFEKKYLEYLNNVVIKFDRG